MTNESSKEFYVHKLYKFVKEHGRTPTSREFGHTSAVIKMFGSYNAFILSQGLTPYTHGGKRTNKKDLEQKLHDFVEKHKRLPKAAEFGRYTTIKRYFGSYVAFIQACGYEWQPNRATGPNLVGQKFGRLTVVSEGEKSGGSTRWNCRCDCGAMKKNVLRGALISAHTTSCGCTIKEALKDYQIEGTNAKLLNLKPTKANTTGVRGVCFVKRDQKYVAYLTFKKNTYHLGSFNTLEEAAAARKEAEEKYFVPFMKKYKDKLSENASRVIFGESNAGK